MDDKNVVRPDDFDALLRSEMSIEPSHGFLPRVRARIDTPPPGTSWLWQLRLIGAAAAAVAVVVVAVNMTSDRRPKAPPTPQASLGQTPPRVSGEPAPAPPVTVRAPAHPPAREGLPRRSFSEGGPRAHTRPSIAVSPSPVSPEVVVDQRQRAALATMIRMVADGRLTNEAFAATTPPSLQPIRDQVTPIAIKLVELSAIDPGGVLPIEK